jgi:hypothetical protein
MAWNNVTEGSEEPPRGYHNEKENPIPPQVQLQPQTYPAVIAKIRTPKTREDPPTQNHRLAAASGCP